MWPCIQPSTARWPSASETYQGVGTPLAGEMQSAAMFPPVLLLLLGGLLYLHVLLELVAGIATFLLLRRLAVSEAVATVGGILFALCGTFAWFANGVVNPIAFLPVLLLGVELLRGAHPSLRRWGMVLAAAAIALPAYAGFPEVAFFDTLFATGWAVLRWVQAHGRRVPDVDLPGAGPGRAAQHRAAGTEALPGRLGAGHRPQGLRVPAGGRATQPGARPQPDRLLPLRPGAPNSR
jgi:hypothetical protein